MLLGLFLKIKYLIFIEKANNVILSALKYKVRMDQNPVEKWMMMFL